MHHHQEVRLLLTSIAGNLGGEGMGRTVGKPHPWILTSVSDHVVQHGGPCLCTSKIAGSEVSRPLAHVWPSHGERGRASPSPVEPPVVAWLPRNAEIAAWLQLLAQAVRQFWTGLYVYST